MRCPPRDRVAPPDARRRRACAAFGCVVALVTLTQTPIAPALGQLVERPPTWSVAVDAGVEWAVPVGWPSPTALLVCDRKSRVQVYNLPDGKPLLDAALEVGGGATCVGSAASVAYVIDGQFAYAIPIPEFPIVAATIQSRPTRARAVADPREGVGDGDPEYTLRLAGGAASGLGPLIARSDGQVALLRGAEARWTLPMPFQRQCRLLAKGELGAALYRSRDGVCAALFRVTGERPEVRARTLGAADPIWTEIAPDALYLAWAGRLARVGASDPADRTVELFDPATPITAAGIGLYAAGPQTDPHAAAPVVERPLVILCARDGQLAAIDLVARKTVWRSATRGVRWTRLRIDGDRALAWADDGAFAAYDATNGRLLAHGKSPAQRTIGVGMTRDWLHAVRVVNARTASGAVRQVVALAGARFDQPQPVELPMESQQQLGPAADLRGVHWTPGRAAVVWRDGIKLYLLP